jgi:hypothetical protein
MIHCEKCWEEELTILNQCDKCRAWVCEGCEIEKCEQGHHDCPFCGAMLSRCSDEDEDDAVIS